MLQKHQPIGCRDEDTKQMLLDQGIEAYVSGCLTLTLEKRSRPPENGKVVISYGRGAGELPGSLLPCIPPNLLKDAALVYQREPVKVMPLGKAEIEEADEIARRLLDFYADTAKLVVTPLLHVASPCIGMGIPVILARKDRNSRFSAINKLVPLHTPEDFRNINWSPVVGDVDSIKEAMTRIVAQLIHGQAADPADIGILLKTYTRSPLEDSFPKAEARNKSRHGIRKWLRWLGK